MTMVDEVLLGGALRDAADGISVPPDGAETIRSLVASASAAGAGSATDIPQDELLAADAADDNGRARVSRARNCVRHHARTLSEVAAVVIVGTLVLLGANGVLPGTRHTETASSSAPSGGAAFSPFAGPSTTVPPSTLNELQSVAPNSSPGAAVGAGAPPNLNSQDIQAQEKAPEGGTPAPAPAPSTSPTPPGVGQAPAIEKTGSVDITVHPGQLNTSMSKLTALATGVSGFVADTQTSEDSGSPSGTITLEVPVASFEAVLNSVRQLGTVTSATTKSTDVTGQVVDIQARIQALQGSLAQYEKILTNASSIGDVLSVQNQIDSIQSQIEQLQGQENLLNAVTVYSTLSVSVSESTTPGKPPPPPPTGLSKAWHTTVHAVAAAFDGLVTVIGPVLFVALCLLAVLVAGRATWRLGRRWTL